MQEKGNNEPFDPLIENDFNQKNPSSNEEEQIDLEDDYPEIDDWIKEIKEEDNDLLILNSNQHEPVLNEGEYEAIVGRISAEEADGEFGPYVKVTIPFNIVNPVDGEAVTIRFMANRSMSRKGKLYPIVKGILGSIPPVAFNLRELEGKEVYVTIKHKSDNRGGIWENVVAARRATR